MKQSVRKLGPWFHNFHLPGGIETAPEHFLGDFPGYKWKVIAEQLPSSLSGWSVLDIGCNAGYYSFELARRGAKVLGIDSDPHYLKQARWLARNFFPENAPEFRRMQVHDLAYSKEAFDLVLFMGVFYHLRYPLLALDTVAAKTRRLMVFQSLTMSGAKVETPERDYPIGKRAVFSKAGWPKMAFVEACFANDPTNWWVPNQAAVEALLRSTGFEKIKRIAHEIYFCKPPRGRASARREWDQSEWLSATGVRRR